MTFGCQMNAHDSRWLAGALIARGFAQTSIERARVVILNTCSVREKPEQKVKTAIGRVRAITGGDPEVLVAVTGCVAQQLGQTLFESGCQVRLVAGSDGINGVPEAVERLLDEPRLRLSLLDFTDHYSEREPVGCAIAGQSRPVTHVTVMQGCDNFCAYCIVPYTRGRQKSRAVKAVLDECRAALEMGGAREIMLLGQNVNAFGRDTTGDDDGFADLLARVAALPGLERLRFVTPHPGEMKPVDIESFASVAPLCPRLHLPVQSGSDRVLARMGRAYTRQDFYNLVAALRKARLDLALSTDIIVGFPGETEEDFNDTLETLTDCNFMSAFSFCYSDRPGTRAALFADKIAPERKQERLLRLQALQESLSGRWLEARLLQQTSLLIETRSPRQPCHNEEKVGERTEVLWQGRDPYGALVHVGLPSGRDHTGRMVPVEITKVGRHSLTGRQTGSAW